MLRNEGLAREGTQGTPVDLLSLERNQNMQTN